MTSKVILTNIRAEKVPDMPLINTPPSCQMVHGGYIEPANPDPADIDIREIAHCLSTAARWSGNCNDLSEDRNPVHYSVGQHSCIVHDLVCRMYGNLNAGFYALMHDASEAYLCDIPRPIKGLITNYYSIEANLMKVIIAKFDIPYNEAILEVVKRIDNAMIFWERDALVGKPIAPYGNEHQHPGGTLYDENPAFTPWSARRAKAEFLARFKYQTEMPALLGPANMPRAMEIFANDNLGFTSTWAGLAHLDFPRVA